MPAWESSSTEPTRDNPLLIGLLVDVSGSMLTVLQSSGGPAKRRLESFRDALDDLVTEGQRLCRDESNAEIVPLFRLFVYGFGFGSPWGRLLGRRVPKVRDLLDVPGQEYSTIPIDQLAEHWKTYQSHVTAMAADMLGDTPMVQAFDVVARRFAEERRRHAFATPPILFVLSDGEPNDGSPDEVVRAAESLRAAGVFIVSCYVTERDITHPRRLYSSPQSGWPVGATLMFNCASVVPPSSAYHTYLREYGWDIEDRSKAFTQINQSEVMNEFVQIVLSPISKRSKLSRIPGHVRVFVSYSHQDRDYLAEHSLLGYLRSLEQEGFDFWTDQRINAGDIWDDEIRDQMAHADIALLLVSHPFLNSKYCRDVEVTTFLAEQRRRGLRIVPIILSACDWKRVDWLRETQCLPPDGKNVESDYTDKGKRAELYLSILQLIRSVGEEIKRSRKR